MLRPNIARCYNEVTRGSIPPPSVFRGRGHIIPRTPTLGCSPIQTNFREVFCLYSIPYHLGEDWGGVYDWHQSKNQWRGHPYGDPHHRWGRQRALGNGDHLLPSWPEQNGGMWCTLCPTPVWLPWAQCSGGKEIHQYPLHSLRNSLGSSTLMSVHFQGGLPLSSSLWSALHLWRLLPYSKTEGAPTSQRGGNGI